MDTLFFVYFASGRAMDSFLFETRVKVIKNVENFNE